MLQETTDLKSSRWLKGRLEGTTPKFNMVGHPASDGWLFARVDVLKFSFKIFEGAQPHLAIIEPFSSTNDAKNKDQTKSQCVHHYLPHFCLLAPMCGTVLYKALNGTKEEKLLSNSDRLNPPIPLEFQLCVSGVVITMFPACYIIT